MYNFVSQCCVCKIHLCFYMYIMSFILITRYLYIYEYDAIYLYCLHLDSFIGRLLQIVSIYTLLDMSFNGQICTFLGNFLVVQWSGLPTYTAKGLSSNSGWVTEIPQATWHSQGEKIKHFFGSVLWIEISRLNGIEYTHF